MFTFLPPSPGSCILAPSPPAPELHLMWLLLKMGSHSQINSLFHLVLADFCFYWQDFNTKDCETKSKRILKRQIYSDNINKLIYGSVRPVVRKLKTGCGSIILKIYPVFYFVQILKNFLRPRKSQEYVEKRCRYQWLREGMWLKL